MNDGNVDCADLKEQAFSNHFDPCFDCGFCDVWRSNKVAFTEVLYQSLVGSGIIVDTWQVLYMIYRCFTIGPSGPDTETGQHKIV